jgi:transcriptional regulator with XRE-family HTH domain
VNYKNCLQFKGVEMDNKKFGEYIVLLRNEKGLEQQELAKMLRVTKKAVSKWERGQRFPDIQLVESLASALGVSIIEIMKSEKIDDQNILSQDVSEAITDIIDVASLQKQKEIRNVLISSILVSVAIMSVLLIGLVPIEAFLLMCMPIIMFGVGVYLIIISIQRKRRKQKFLAILVLGLLALLYPILAFLFMAFAMAIGGPIPT